jgi:beta-lactamase superfamily II metal-dependent hydrolase
MVSFDTRNSKRGEKEGKMPTFTFFAVDKGNMTLIEFSNGINMMVDCRRSADRPSPLEYLRSKIRKLDIVVVSHPHQDHLTGFQEVCEFFKPKHLWHCGRYFKPDPVFDDWTFYEKARNGQLAYCAQMPVRAGQTINIADSRIIVLAPRLPFIENTVDDVNNNGIILSVITGKSKVIITGDTQEEQWETVDAAQLVGASVFLASHHGRESGFSDPIMKSMHPQRIIISDGACCETDVTEQYKRIAPVSTTRLNSVVVAQRTPVAV